MLRRFLALVAVTLGLAVPAVIVSTTAPASAASASRCVTLPNDTVTCANLTFQAGWNLAVTSVGLSTPSGCGKLEDSGGRYGYLDLRTHRMDYHWGPQGCSPSIGVWDECRGCTSGRIVHVYTKARVNMGTDVRIHWTFTLRNDGGYTSSWDWSWVPGE